MLPGRLDWHRLYQRSPKQQVKYIIRRRRRCQLHILREQHVGEQRRLQIPLFADSELRVGVRPTWTLSGARLQYCTASLRLQVHMLTIRRREAALGTLRQDRNLRLAGSHTSRFSKYMQQASAVSTCPGRRAAQLAPVDTAAGGFDRFRRCAQMWPSGSKVEGRVQ